MKKYLYFVEHRNDKRIYFYLENGINIIERVSENIFMIGNKIAIFKRSKWNNVGSFSFLIDTFDILDIDLHEKFLMLLKHYKVLDKVLSLKTS